jgi:hypothetical protein
VAGVGVGGVDRHLVRTGVTGHLGSMQGEKFSMPGYSEEMGNGEGTSFLVFLLD